MTDPYVGTLTFFRVYSGVLESGRYVFNSTKGKKERIGRLLQDARQQARGDQGGLRRRHRGRGRPARHHDRRHALRRRTSRSSSRRSSSPSRSSRSPSSPRPRPTRRSSASRCRSWPPRIRRSASQTDTRPARRSSPAWASSTSRSSSTACCASSRSRRTSASRRSRTARRSGRRSSRKASSCGRPAAAASTATWSSALEPLPPGGGLRVRRRDQGRRRPARVHPGRREGRSRGMRDGGVLAGYPVVDVKVDADRRLVPRGRFVRDGVQDRRLDGVQGGGRKASPILLEPIMAVEVVVPEDFMGDVIGDLSSRRGKIQGMEARGGAQVITRRCRSPRCSATPPTCARGRRGAPPTRCSSRTTSRCRRRSPRRSSLRPWARKPRAAESREERAMAKAEVRAKEAARERGDDRARGPREDDVDGGDHEGAGGQEAGELRAVRPDRQGAGGEGARDHDRDGARGVRDRRSGTTRTWTARGTRTTSRT